MTADLRHRLRAVDGLLLAGAALIVFLLAGPVMLIPVHVPLSYNEGWNAYFQQRAVQPGAGPLYPPADALLFNNYPPLSFYLIGAFGRFVTGDMIVAGRIADVTSLVASAVLLGLCVRRLGGSVRGGLTASGLLLLYSTTVFRDYAAIDDPQWLGHALMLAGLLTLLSGREAARPTVWRAAAAALLVTAGGFVKHNLVGLPLGVSVWLLLVWPRAAAGWLAAALAGVAGGAMATGLLHGHAAFVDILEHRRIFNPARAGKTITRLLPLLPMMLIAVLARPRRPDTNRSMLLAWLFLSISLVTGIVQKLGEGVNYNASFETMIALCLAVGLVVSRAPVAPLFVDRLPFFRTLTIAPPALVLIASLPVLWTMPRHLDRAWSEIAGRGARERSWQPVIARIEATPGPVACEMLSLCYWAGRPAAFDQFNLNQSLLLGGPNARLDGLIRGHVFRMIQYDGALVTGRHVAGDLKGDPLLTELLAQGYAPTASGPGGIVFLEPQPASGGAGVGAGASKR